MVKGISRQVIVVHPQDEKLFDQAIFILREDAKPVTEEALLKEAERLMRSNGKTKKVRRNAHLAWAGMGGAAVGLAWLMTALL